MWKSSMGFSDDPWVSVALVITAAVNVVGRDGGDVAATPGTCI